MLSDTVQVSGRYSLDNTRSNTPMHCNSKQETMVGRLAEILTAKDDKSKEIFNLKWRKKCGFFFLKRNYIPCVISSNVIPLSAVCNGWVFPFLIHNPHTDLMIWPIHVSSLVLSIVGICSRIHHLVEKTTSSHYKAETTNTNAFNVYI